MNATFEAKLQTELMAAMGDEKYNFDDFYKLYVRVMSQSFDLKYPIITAKTFGNKVITWSNTEGSWLIRRGIGKKAIYHKWVCHRSHMTRRQLQLSAKRIWEGLASWRK